MLKIKPPDYQYCPFCGRKLGEREEEGKRRKYCGSCGWTYYPHVGASAAAVIVREKEVLMVKRRREPYKDTWMFPAGFVDFGEHPEETLKREVKEETGLEVKSWKLIDVLQSEDDPRSPGHFVFFYLVKVEEGELETEEEENSDVDWQEIDNPPEIGWQLHRKIMKELRKGLIKT